MKFQNFSVHAVPHLHDAFCECGDRLTEVSNGLFSNALYCHKCENVYLIKMVKAPKNKVTEEFLEQCREEIEIQKIKSEAVKKYREKKQITWHLVLHSHSE